MFDYYVYKKPHVRLLIGLYDTAGNLVARKSKPKNLAPPKHIVSIILHQIGDVVMTLPALEAMHELFPGAKHTLIVGKAPTPLLKTNPWEAEVITFDALWQKKVRQLGSYKQDGDANAAETAFFELLGKENLDLALVFHPDLKVNQILGRTKIPATFGFSNAGGGFALSFPMAMPKHGHQVERNFVLAKSVAESFGMSTPRLKPPQLTLPQEAINRTKKKLEDLNVGSKKRVILHPFASDKARDWNEKGWYEVITWLEQEGYQAVVIGSPQDSFTLPKEMKKARNLCGQLSLEETAALISQSDLFIGVNSGPGHIAAALGCPVVSIFSATHNPKRWAPYGQKGLVEVLYVPPTDERFMLPANRELELTSLPDDVEGNPFTDGITSKAVVTAAQKLLNPQKGSKTD